MRHSLGFCILIFSLLLTFSGCSIMKTAGNAVVNYTQTEAIPYLMAIPDVEAASAMGLSMGPVITSFERIDVETEEVAIATDMAAGMAAENQQRESELQKLRALYENRTNEAQDALIREKTHHMHAAARFYSAYKNSIAAFGYMDQECPDFETDIDELLGLLGVASGALGILHDFNSEKATGIPLDVPVAIINAADCFDNQKWWGMPLALKAAIWMSIPGAAPDGIQPIDALEEAAQIGDAQGVLLPRALLVQMAKAVGEKERMCKAIDNLTQDTMDQLDPNWGLLNAYAISMIRHQADILWTEAQGSRTPFQMLTCPQSTSSTQTSDLDNLLEDIELDDETPTQETQFTPSDVTPKETTTVPNAEATP